MAKLRSVNTKFWDDNYITNLDPVEKLLFLYLLTCPLTNIAGIYEIMPRRIAFDTGIDKEMIEKILERFEKDKKIYYRDGWVGISNFIKNQTLNPKIIAGIRYELPKAPKALLELLNIDSSVFKQKIIRKKISKKLRTQILERDGWKCVKCGDKYKVDDGWKLEIDHIKPVALGGDNNIENLRALCQKCNGKRNAELRWNKDGEIMGGLSDPNSNPNLNSNLNLNLKWLEKLKKQNPVKGISG